jgi:hypothetical protein
MYIVSDFKYKYFTLHFYYMQELCWSCFFNILQENIILGIWTDALKLYDLLIIGIK